MNRNAAGRLAGLIALTALAAAAPFAGAVTVGEPAPEFSATGTDGKTYSLSDFRGKVVVLEWTNHKCPYVRKHYDSGNMQALQRAATDDGVVWLTVISSAPGKQGHVSAEEADRLTASRDAAPTQVLLDPEGDVGLKYRAKTTPHMYIVDADGTLVYQGGIDDRPTANKADVDGAHNYVRAALTEVAAGEPVSDSDTRPYGCSVKYN